MYLCPTWSSRCAGPGSRWVGAEWPLAALMQMQPSQSWVMSRQSEDLHETLHALVCKSSEDSCLPSSQKQTPSIF